MNLKSSLPRHIFATSDAYQEFQALLNTEWAWVTAVVQLPVPNTTSVVPPDMS